MRSCGPLRSADLSISPTFGLPVFGDCIRVLYDTTVGFLHTVVVHRKDVAVRNWRAWVLEDGGAHPYRWLRPDQVAPAPLLCCDPCLTVDGSGVLSDPDRIDEQFRQARLPFFCRADRGAVDLSVFEVGGWLPCLGEIAFPLLSGAFPVSFFDWLAVLLSGGIGWCLARWTAGCVCCHDSQGGW